MLPSASSHTLHVTIFTLEGGTRPRTRWRLPGRPVSRRGKHTQIVTGRESARVEPCGRSASPGLVPASQLPHSHPVDEDTEAQKGNWNSSSGSSSPAPPSLLRRLTLPSYTLRAPSAPGSHHHIGCELPLFLLRGPHAPIQAARWENSARRCCALGLDPVGMTQLLVPLTFFLTQTLDCGQCRSSLTL